MAQTREAQYQELTELEQESFGLMSGHAWQDDPRRLAFTLARYKFVAKMLEGKTTALEVGCGDAMWSRIVRQSVKQLKAVDFDDIFISDANARKSDRWPVEHIKHDMVELPLPENFDAVYSLDVFEHISPSDERKFLANIVSSLHKRGTLILGTPSLASQAIASPLSKQGHVNCKNAPELKELLSEYFHYIFMFGMNDETLHTGHHMMSHYLFAVACEPKTIK